MSLMGAAIRGGIGQGVSQIEPYMEARKKAEYEAKIRPLQELLLGAQGRLATAQAEDYPAQKAFQRRMMESRQLGVEGQNRLDTIRDRSREGGLLDALSRIQSGVADPSEPPSPPDVTQPSEDATEGPPPWESFEPQTGGEVDVKPLSNLLNPQRGSEGMVAGAAGGVPRPSGTPIGRAADPLDAKIRALLPPGVEYKPYDDVARQKLINNSAIRKEAEAILSDALMPRVQKRQARLAIDLMKIRDHRAILESMQRSIKLRGAIRGPALADMIRTLDANEAVLTQALSIQQGTQETPPGYE